MARLERVAIVVFLLWLAVGSCSARGMCLGLCGSEIFTCQCGPEPGPIVNVSVIKCTFIYRWRPYCHASDGYGEKAKWPGVCLKYQQCLTCAQDGGSCSSCPPGKHGTFCDEDCPCINGGQCLGTDASCVCPPGFQGEFCETGKGCPLLELVKPLKAVGIPEEDPIYMEFSCPSSGYLLEGSRTLTCLNKTNEWNHPVPSCVSACTTPNAPPNGQILNAASGNNVDLVRKGHTLDFKCNQGFFLIGPTKITCTIDGDWSHEPPICIELSFCRKPDPVMNARYEEHPPPSQPPFSNGTKIVYSCLDGFFMFGKPQLVCSSGGHWSSDAPDCVKVFDSEVNCTTLGSQVVEGIGEPIRVYCPPGCAGENVSVWGTVIYEDGSSVCKAAVHSGRISNLLGGSLYIVSNGPYDDFVASTINAITSERKHATSGSFRFQYDPDLDLQNKEVLENGCPRGWIEAQDHCLYVVAKRLGWREARGFCSNMGSRLLSLHDPGVINDVLKSRSDVESFWLLSKSQNNITPTYFPLWAGHDLTPNPAITILLLDDDKTDENLQTSNQTTCSLIRQQPDGPVWTTKPCSENASFICGIDVRMFLVRCENRDQLENGLVILQDPKLGFRRGAVVNFRCKEMHELRGEPVSTCLPNGTWSSPLPTCQRIPACLDPPKVHFGYYVMRRPIMSVKSGEKLESLDPVNRISRRGIPEFKRHKRSVFEEIKELPDGYQGQGSKATFYCESKYYKLTGSKFRRCQEDGTWSGTPVTCIPICGISDTPRTPFIYKGNSTDIGQWPWQVGLAHNFMDGNNRFIACGASLLNEYWVVTAAHCVVDDLSGPLRPQEILLYVGKYYRDDSQDDSFVQVRKASDVRVHRDYDARIYNSDIALVKMESPVTLTSRVQPVCLPTDRSTLTNMTPGKKGVATGWGFFKPQTYSATLQQVVLPVVSHEECEEAYSVAGLPLSVTENMFCAGVEVGHTGTCEGDSGGPLVFQMNSGSSKYWVLEGIVSWGSLNGCGIPRQYGGFTKVHRFLEWIEQNMT